MPQSFFSFKEFLCFLVGAVLYVVAALVAYRASSMPLLRLLVAGALLGAATNVLWVLVARGSLSSDRLFVLALCWDVMITSAFVVVGLLVGASLTGVQALGAVLTVIGVLLLR